MDAITMIKERRSVRKYKDEKVDRETMREIVDIARWAPSWVNYQIARYTLVDDEEIIKEIVSSVANVKGEVTETLSIAKKSDEQINKTMEEYEEIVEASEKLITEIYNVGNEINKVNENQKEVMIKVDSVTQITEEQSAHIEEINATIQTQTESIEEVTKVVYEINEISKRIDEKVAKYKIREEIVSINTEEE